MFRVLRSVVYYCEPFASRNHKEGGGESSEYIFSIRAGHATRSTNTPTFSDHDESSATPSLKSAANDVLESRWAELLLLPPPLHQTFYFSILS